MVESAAKARKLLQSFIQAEKKQIKEQTSVQWVMFVWKLRRKQWNSAITSSDVSTSKTIHIFDTLRELWEHGIGIWENDFQSIVALRQNSLGLLYESIRGQVNVRSHCSLCGGASHANSVECSPRLKKFFGKPPFYQPNKRLGPVQREKVENALQYFPKDFFIVNPSAQKKVISDLVVYVTGGKEGKPQTSRPPISTAKPHNMNVGGGSGRAFGDGDVEMDEEVLKVTWYPPPRLYESQLLEDNFDSVDQVINQPKPSVPPKPPPAAASPRSERLSRDQQKGSPCTPTTPRQGRKSSSSWQTTPTVHIPMTERRGSTSSSSAYKQRRPNTVIGTSANVERGAPYLQRQSSDLSTQNGIPVDAQSDATSTISDLDDTLTRDLVYAGRITGMSDRTDRDNYFEWAYEFHRNQRSKSSASTHDDSDVDLSRIKSFDAVVPRRKFRGMSEEEEPPDYGRKKTLQLRLPQSVMRVDDSPRSVREERDPFPDFQAFWVDKNTVQPGQELPERNARTPGSTYSSSREVKTPRSWSVEERDLRNQRPLSGYSPDTDGMEARGSDTPSLLEEATNEEIMRYNRYKASARGTVDSDLEDDSSQSDRDSRASPPPGGRSTGGRFSVSSSMGISTTPCSIPPCPPLRVSSGIQRSTPPAPLESRQGGTAQKVFSFAINTHEKVVPQTATRSPRPRVGIKREGTNKPGASPRNNTSKKSEKLLVRGQHDTSGAHDVAT